MPTFCQLQQTGHKKTAAAPCADDPRIVYRPLDETYYMTYGNDSGLTQNMSSRVQWIGTSKTYVGKKREKTTHNKNNTTHFLSCDARALAIPLTATRLYLHQN